MVSRVERLLVLSRGVMVRRIDGCLFTWVLGVLLFPRPCLLRSSRSWVLRYSLSRWRRRPLDNGNPSNLRCPLDCWHISSWELSRFQWGEQESSICQDCPVLIRLTFIEAIEGLR